MKQVTLLRLEPSDVLSREIFKNLRDHIFVRLAMNQQEIAIEVGTLTSMSEIVYYNVLVFPAGKPWYVLVCGCHLACKISCFGFLSPN
jgi:hypothetical protein